jgi:hypothetical protein
MWRTLVGGAGRLVILSERGDPFLEPASDPF